MSDKAKDIALTVVFFGIIVVIFILHIITPDQDISREERRKLHELPRLSADNIIFGGYFDSYEKYYVDQFPCRNSFRLIKSFINTKLLLVSDNNGLFIVDGSIYKLDSKLMDNWIKFAAKRMSDSIEKMFPDANVYLAVIPDKSHYIAEKTKYPIYSFFELEDRIVSLLPGVTHIPIYDALNENDFYKTDVHWRQDRLGQLVKRLGENLGFEPQQFNSLIWDNLYPFYGGYYNQAAISMPPETLTYLDNRNFSNVHVYDYAGKRYIPIHSLELFDNVDPYDVFLSGPLPLLVIENNNDENDHELVVFRDSFGSSLVPLLIPYYSKITVVDSRYIVPEYAATLVDFSTADVLFIYSSGFLNYSASMR